MYVYREGKYQIWENTRGITPIVPKTRGSIDISFLIILERGKHEGEYNKTPQYINNVK